MNALQIIQGAKMAGLCLHLSKDGRVQVLGRGISYQKWLPILKENKAQIVPVLRNIHQPIAYEPPYLIQYFDPLLKCLVMRPYIETEWFIEELRQARDYLRSVYLKGIDTVILADNSLDLVPCGNHQPSQVDWQDAKRYQHGIRAHLLGEPFNLFETNGGMV
jgi:hypothetical protein